MVKCEKCGKEIESYYHGKLCKECYIKSDKDKPKQDGSGKGVRANRGRGGCLPPRDKGIGDFTEDFISDMSEWNGYLTHSGPFLYIDKETGEEIIKYKDPNNLRDVFGEKGELEYIPLIGVNGIGSHLDIDERVLGAAYDWRLIEPGEIGPEGEDDIDAKELRVYAQNGFTFEDINEISGLEDPSNLNLSLGFKRMDETKDGKIIQNIKDVRHIAMSLDNSEVDNCRIFGHPCVAKFKRTEETDMVSDDHENQNLIKNSIKKIKNEAKNMSQKIKKLLKKKEDDTEEVETEVDLTVSGDGNDPAEFTNEQGDELQECMESGKSKDECLAQLRRTNIDGKRDQEYIDNQSGTVVVPPGSDTHNISKDFAEKLDAKIAKLEELEAKLNPIIKEQEAKLEQDFTDTKAYLAKVEICPDLIKTYDFATANAIKKAFESSQLIKDALIYKDLIPLYSGQSSVHDMAPEVKKSRQDEEFAFLDLTHTKGGS